jgi:hypothetical protein
MDRVDRDKLRRLLAPRASKRFWWPFSLTIVAAAAVGAICGYTGMVTSEYRATPLNQAIIMAAMFALDWGLILGAVVGAICELMYVLRRR